MIDFRYHLVSIVAVFLALAIGIVVGSTALQGRVVSALNRASKAEVKHNDQLRAQNKVLLKQLEVEDLVDKTASGYLFSHLLEGERVVLVTAPGADSQTVSGITSAVRTAGATVTGQVSLTAQYFDISKITESNLFALAQSLAPAGISLPPSAAASPIYGQQAAAQVIAAAIVNTGSLATVSQRQSQRILGGFGQQGYLQISGPGGSTVLAGQATLAVVVIPAVPASNASSPANLALVAVAHELQRASAGTLIAGSLPGSGPGSAIDAITSGATGVELTTVDNANTASGQIIVVWALRKLLDPHAVAAAYGVVPAAVPQPGTEHGPDPATQLASHHYAVGTLSPGEVMNRRGIVRFGVAGAGAKIGYAVLTRWPPGGEKTWTRTNHRGEPLTLLEGPAVTVAAATAALTTPGLDGSLRSALALAGAAAVRAGSDQTRRDGS